MGKLYFKYGPMAAGKSTHLLQAAHNYKTRGMHVKLFTSALDNRSGTGVISSRIGISAEAEIIENNENGVKMIKDLIQRIITLEEKVHVVFVDESQFLSAEVIDALSDLVDTIGINVLCYGIRTDFETKLFSGSARLFELADSTEELKHICSCGKKAVMNARIVDSAEKVLIGAEDAYQSMCRKCYKEFMKKKDE